jgi:hypothetical protein
MPSATTSGADSNGSARSREHTQGNQDRKYTPEQKAAVIRVRKCSPTAFYEILAVQKTATDGEIKKAYRKLSLLTHPDKNGYEGADEAFKSVFIFLIGEGYTVANRTIQWYRVHSRSSPIPIKSRDTISLAATLIADSHHPAQVLDRQVPAIHLADSVVVDPRKVGLADPCLRRRYRPRNCSIGFSVVDLGLWAAADLVGLVVRLPEIWLVSKYTDRL